ncbi:MAG: hypothetical protein JKY11_01520 [Alphaproteobacteria bacterium]|nr:hypothetical protein [Alphaproteobacteria bacterium]
MGGLLIEEDLLVKQSIIDKDTPEGQKIHNFLLGRAKRLVGHRIDFNKNPVAFVMSDSEEPNAFFAKAPEKDKNSRRRRDEYKNVRSVINPYDTPIICVTKGLIDMVDNIDQLDYVLGHELTHMIFRGYGVAQNSKGEETLADLHAVDLIYDAGSDPKQALLMEEKLNEYAKQQSENEREKRYSNDEEEEGIKWSEIFDVHMMHGNRESAIEASLTRLSHLIDDRTPSEFDKSVFAEEYVDPISSFLKNQRYKNQKPLGKLRILVDCIEHLSAQIPAEEFFQAQLDALPQEGSDDWNSRYELQHKRQRIQEVIDAGYSDYFSGKTIEKKYQHKIAWLAEGVIQQVNEERRQKGNDTKPARVHATDLNVYLQNKAYEHIQQNGYPQAGDRNYSDAAGIVYTYFHTLFKETISSKREQQYEENGARTLPQIEIDITSAKQKIYTAKEATEFKQVAEEFKTLLKIRKDLMSTSYGYNGNGNKLDNLSFVETFRLGGSYDFPDLYSEPQVGECVPWNNLVEIAKTDEKTKEYVVEFLQEHRIEDFRITHNEQYIRKSNYHCHAVNDNGILSDRNVEKFELGYIVNKELVIEAHSYIQNYFDNESAFFDKTCESILHLEDKDFLDAVKIESKLIGDDRVSVARKKIRDFTMLYNSLPKLNSGKNVYRGDNSGVLSLITAQYLTENRMPSTNEHGNSSVDDELFEFENPIFEKRFGKDFKDKIITEKKEQTQRMFNTTIDVVNMAADIWAEASLDLEKIKEKTSALWKEIGRLKDGDEKEKKDLERSNLYRDEQFSKERVDVAENVFYNYLCSIFNGDKYWYTLNRLTPEQKNILANYVVKDEKGVFTKVFNDERYASFCDFAGVLPEQTEKILSGNYELTEIMQVVTKNIGYQKTETKEDLKNRAIQHYKDKYHISKYKSYLHMFDTMQSLGKSNEIDVSSLCKTVSCIQEGGRSNQGSDSEEMARARYDNYRSLVTESNLLELISNAVSYKGNYEELSFGETVDTVDRLASMRGQMEDLLVEERSKDYYDEEGYLSSKTEKIVQPDHGKFLDFLDRKVRGLIRKAHYQALHDDDALEKITDLYRVYNPEGDRWSEGSKRGSYLSEINRKEKPLETISSLSESREFWPEDVLDHAKAFVFAKNTFLDGIELEDKILNNIFDKLEELPSGRKKNECFFILLDKNLRASYPETRERLFKIYSQDMLVKLGKDDGSEQYEKRLSIYLKALESDQEKQWDIGKNHGERDGLLSNSMAAADKYVLLRQVSDTIVSQEKTSEMMKDVCQVNLNSKNLAASYLYGVGVDYLTSEMDEDSDTANRFIQFLNSKGEAGDCADMSEYIGVTIREKHNDPRYQDHLDRLLEQTKPVNCKVLYENFWSAPLEARAVIIARMLKSAVNSEASNNNTDQQSWENVFDVVMDNIISPDDTSKESKYARDIMHSYIKARSDYERELILSAMMVANRNIGKDAGNVGKALKLFLENMGPAEIKLGQAIASHPDTPESIRVELQELKNAADKPARWTLYDWIKAENVPEELWKNEYLGEILGSASYYTTVELGEDKVLRMLRPEAREKAIKGFRVIGETIDDLKLKDQSSDLDYKELTSSVAEMVTQAARMSGIETDHELGQKQYEDAQKIYNGATISSGSETFTLKVMDWNVKGKNWIVMDKANGLMFNDLPEETSEQVTYKKDFAKSYIVFEVMNILAGSKFDHDWHGAQLCIDKATNEVGIFDTGAMALEAPTPAQQKILGHIIYDVVKNSMDSKNPFMALGSALNDKIEDLHNSGTDTQYLVEVKKGLLALGDFFKVLDADDMKDIMPNMGLLSGLSEHVSGGVAEKMSMVEKAQVKMLMATKLTSSYNNVTIARTTVGITSNVANVNVEATVQGKASWLQTAFSDLDAEEFSNAETQDLRGEQVQSYVSPRERVCC